MSPYLRTFLARWAPTFILFTVGLIFINLIWLLPSVRNIRVSASVLALEIADRVRSQTSSYLETALTELTSAADEIAQEPDRSTIVLERLLKKNMGLRYLTIIDRGGTEELRINRPNLPPRGAEDHARDSVFYLALEGAPNFGDIVISSESEPHVALAVPIRTQDKTERVLLGDLNLRALMLAARTLKLKRGHIYIVDKNGLQIAHPDVAEILKRPNFSTRPIVQKVITDGLIVDGLASGDGYTNDAGETVFAVGVPIPIANLGLFVEQPRDQAFSGQRQAVGFAVATVFLGMMIFIFMIRGNVRLSKLNGRLQEFLRELDSAGKMLVRRDLELTHANVRLEELDKMKSEFVSVAAHQLRTPLTGIKWALSSLLEEEGLKPEQQKIIRDALAAASRLTELINDLLNVARIEEGKFGFHMSLQSLVPTLQSAYLRFKKIADEKAVRFSLELPDDHLPLLNFDEEKISIVLDNLADNAIKYTPPSGIVTASLRRDGDSVVVEVKDSGIGIPKNQTHRVFTKFFRSPNAQLYETDGTGLGLYVTKNIVEEHGGNMWFESNEGAGTSFYFTLPIPKTNNV